VLDLGRHPAAEGQRALRKRLARRQLALLVWLDAIPPGLRPDRPHHHGREEDRQRRHDLVRGDLRRAQPLPDECQHHRHPHEARRHQQHRRREADDAKHHQ
jgi:hypothetical protein